MRIPLNGHRIQSVEFGFQFVLRMGLGTEVCVESTFLVFDAGVLQFDGPPTAASSDHVVLRQLTGREVVAAAATDQGDLQIELEGSTHLTVASNPNYEAWTVAGHRGLKVVSMPGGGIATWGLP